MYEGILAVPSEPYISIQILAKTHTRQAIGHPSINIAVRPGGKPQYCRYHSYRIGKIKAKCQRIFAQCACEHTGEASNLFCSLAISVAVHSPIVQ